MTVLRATKIYDPQGSMPLGTQKRDPFLWKAPVFVTVLLFPIYRQYVNEIYHEINF